MENRYFANKTLEMLLRPESWRVACTRFAPENDPVCEIQEHQFIASSLHRHAHREILFVLDGEGEYGACGHVYPCHPGAIFPLDSFEEHQLFYPPSFPDADHLWVFVFEDHLLSRCNRIRGGDYNNSGIWSHLLPARGVDAGIASRIFGSHHTANELPADLHRMEVYAGLTSLILTIVRDGYSIPSDENPGSFQGRVISTICDHIQRTAGKGASLDMLARMSGYSKFHFLRLFKEHTGLSVHRYIDCCRLERVAEMQRHGRYKREIAEELGFSCLSAFLRWHRRVRECQ